MPQRPLTSRTLPVITNQHSLVQYLQSWRHSLSKTLQRPPAPAVPWNFAVTNARGGMSLTWAPVPGSDGYELLRSDNGDFSGAPGSNMIVIPLQSSQQTSYFDALGGAAVTKSYRVRATSGSQSAPQSTKGNPSGVVMHTSIDSTDTTTAPTTLYDGATTQTSQVGSGGHIIVGGTGQGSEGFQGTGGGAGKGRLDF